MVKDGLAGGGTYPFALVNVNGTLFFGAHSSASGAELWRSDGTEAGTVMIKDIDPGPGGSLGQYSDLTNIGGTLFFTAYDPTHGNGLWRSNGTATGTVLVKAINPARYSSYPANLTDFRGSAFFTASDGTHGIELWKTNGSAAGTFMVKDIAPGVYDSGPSFLTTVGGTLFFSADDRTHGIELWRSDGTGQGTRLVRDIDPGSPSSSPKYLTIVNGTLFFEAGGPGASKLWQSNGTAAGTQKFDLVPGPNGAFVSQLANVGGTLFFSARDTLHGLEPWILEPLPRSVASSPLETIVPSPGPEMRSPPAGVVFGVTDQRAAAADAVFAILPRGGTPDIIQPQIFPESSHRRSLAHFTRRAERLLLVGDDVLPF
jgi:ELWxxDGT repeat protein